MASEQFSLCWDNFHKNMSSGMNSLLENEDLVDVTLAVEGKCLKAHKMVLSVCSPYFKELFKSNPCQHPIVFMKDVSYVAISDLLQFMYQGEVQVSQENLTTFIKTAEALQIKGLTGDGNGSVDNDESVHEKSTPAPEDTYKPVPRPKKQPPTPVVSSTPAPKRQRLSDSQPTPSAVVTKTEPVNSSSAETPPVQFKVEPYDQNQTLTIPDDDGDNFGDDTLDDNTADDTEDYSMMEGEEPQAGTSTDGAGEGQGLNLLLSHLIHIRKQNNQILAAVNNHRVKTCEECVHPELKDLLPFNSHEDILAFEIGLTNDDISSMICHLSRLGGKGVAGKTNRILKEVITDSLASCYNFCGKHNKIAFNRLKLKDIVVQSVKKTSKESTELEVENAIKRYLKHSPARLKLAQARVEKMVEFC
ncbi:protein tramtrack, beta isoform-like isoform X5 [Cylas formicarius]|uniref:protein tramtrack, beta isoform-like isoform X5 n=1 Tax=Cylas formicarius TaxID=197179 RepID=UPI002958A3E0|nr:protein tramtrack, beta isoform-like isoform X5 [Cylas formicarius]